MNARLRFYSYLIAVIVLGMTLKAFGQEPPNVTDYIDPATAYHTSNFDYVDPLNDRLALNIPLLVDHSQLGNLNFTYSVRYSSTTAWFAVPYDCAPPNNVCYRWQPANNSVTGPSFSMDGNLRFGFTDYYLCGGGCGFTVANSADEDSGAQHFLGTLSGTQRSPCNFTAESVDGSGIQAVVGANCTQDLSAYTFINRQGVQFNGDTTGFGGVFSGGKIQDTNGNKLTFSCVNGSSNVCTWTGGEMEMADTVGRVWGFLYNTATDGCPSGASVAELWEVPGPNGQMRDFTFCFTNISISTAFGFSGISEYNNGEPLMTAVILPDGTSWQFGYDNFGELTSIQLPTGGTVNYNWTGHDAQSQPWCAISGAIDCEARAVMSRTTSDGSQWSYNGFTVTDPAGNDTVYNPMTPNDVADDGRLNSIQYYSGPGGGNLLKTAVPTYQVLNNPYPNDLGNSSQVTYLPSGTETQWPNGLTSQSSETYDSGFLFNDDNNGQQYSGIYGLVTGVTVSDYGSSGPGPTLSVTQTAYKALSGDPNAPSYLSANVLDLISSTTVFDVSGHQVAQTSHFYDENNGSPQCVCGNQTSVTRWLNTGGSSPTTRYVYNSSGLPYQMIDPNNNSTSYAYDSTGAFLQWIFHPPVNNTIHVEGFTYDSNTGVLLKYTDENSNVTNYANYDSMLRVGEIDYPDQGQTNYSYPNSTEVVVTRKLSNVAPSNVTTYVFDGFGRLTQTQVTSGQGTISVDQSYSPDPQHHTFLQTVSNPHYSASSATDGTAKYTYDALGRLVNVADPDGDTITHAYISDGTRMLDQKNDEAGDTTNTWMDSLGRVNQVNIFPNSVTRTQYYYDALNNLIESDESGSNYSNDRIRTFSYDSLSRLISATNPESGTTGYAYDSNGNVITRTRPRANQTSPSVTTTTNYSYDALNRLSAVNYSDGTVSTSMLYDVQPDSNFNVTVPNPIGRLTEVSEPTNVGSVAGEAFGYDTMGRISVEVQCTPGSCYANSNEPGCPCSQVNFTLLYYYDVAGNLISSYNSEMNAAGGGTGLSYSYDSGMRLMSVSSGWNDSQHPAALTIVDPNLGYWPTGQVRVMTLGNGLAETSAYNNRLEPCRINVNSSGTYLSSCTDAIPNGNMQDYSYGYGGQWNNGDVWSWTATGNQNFNRSYTYDGSDRLVSMSAPGDTCSGLSWLYDPWNNRTDQKPTGGTCNPFAQAFNSNNQLIGYQYDAAGNLINDGVYTYTYDAENRITRVGGGSTSVYYYDARGLRVGRVYNGLQTGYVYDLSGNVVTDVQDGTFGTGYVYFGGKLLAEYQNGATYFVHPDHLGSTRLMTTYSQTQGQNQQIYDSMDYLPFGEQIAGSSGTTHKFTGQERDSDTGNDYFGARYFGSSIGRFLSADDPLVDQHTGDPQSWNLYSYVRNNPLRFTDPDGRECSEDENGNFVGDCASPGDEAVTQSNQSQTPFSVFEPPSDALNPVAMAVFTDPILQNTIGTFDNVIGPAFLIEMSFLPGVLEGSMAPVGAGLSLQAMRPPTLEGPEGQASKIIDADQVIFRPQNLKHALRFAPDHSTPLGDVEEIKFAVQEAIRSGSYTEGADGAIRGRVMIQGVEHEFTAGRNPSGQIIFSNIYRVK